jgi:predicted nuclease with TOPRIM domain
MELMTSRWTDERMDDLKHQVDQLGRRMEEGFAGQHREMNARFDRLESSLEARFEKVDERFEKVEACFEKVDQRFEKVDERFEKVDAKFEAIHDQIVRTQEMVIGLHATLTRFSLGFLGAALVAIIAALLAQGS